MDVVALITKTRSAITKLLIVEMYGGIVHTTIGVETQVLAICSTTSLKNVVHLLSRSRQQQPVRLQKYVRYRYYYLLRYNDITIIISTQRSHIHFTCILYFSHALPVG